jgi:YD repeat-containing protein
MRKPWFKVVFVLLVCALVEARAFADDPLPGYYQDPGLNPFRTTVNHNVDEHIDPFTGMLQLHHVDMTWPGNGGFDLTLQRSFNSPGSKFQTIGNIQSYSSTPNLGVGWNLFIGGRVFNAIAACSGTSTQMAFQSPDGGMQGLIATGNGDFWSVSFWRATCIPGGGVNVYAPNGTNYTMTQFITEAIANTIPPETSAFLYPTQIADRNGNTASFGYGTIPPPNQLSPPFTVLNSVTTSDGRTLSFNYGTIGTSPQPLLGSITAGQRTWTFEYYLTPAIVSVSSGLGIAFFLSGVTPPAGGAWSYQYVLPGYVGAYSISQFSYPEGGNIAYTYADVNFNDGTGNQFAVVSKQTGTYNGLVAPTNNTWTYTYTPGKLGVNDMTTVTSPVGKMTYEHVGFGTVVAGSTWQIGSLMQVTQQELSSSTTQIEAYTWDKLQISIYATNRGYGVNDGVTYAPIMTQHAVTRYGGSPAGGSTYTTTNSKFDTYGNPGTIVESGERTHTITRAYYVDPIKWILHTPANESTTGLGSIIRSFDANGNLLSENRYGVTTSYTYSSADGSVTSKTDANGNATVYSLYDRGTPQVEQRPAEVTINRTVDDAGNVLSQTDGAGNTYSYSYDGIRRLIGKTPPVGAATTVSWAGSNLATATRGAYVETRLLDGLANPYIVTRNGIQSAFAYDALSRKLFDSEPGLVTVHSDNSVFAYGTLLVRDILGRIISATHSDTSVRTYQDDDFALVETDENNHATTYLYQAFADPDDRFLTGMELPNGNNITIGRDDMGDITSVAQGSVTRTYAYNGSFFLTGIADPETGTTAFGRDAVGNMTSRQVGNKTTNFTYDGLNRLTNIAYPSSGSVTITYLGNGRTASVTNNQATRTYAYDGNANLTSETLTVGGQTFTTKYSYNGNDALASMTYPNTGDVVTYAPDPLGRATSAAPFVTAVGYFDSGNPNQITYASGVTMNYTENIRQWPTSLIGRLGGTGPSLVNKAYGYDPTGNVSFVNDNVNPFQSLVMSYDPNDQLTGVYGPWTGQATMTYDPVGNLKTYMGSASRIYTYDGTNKLSSVAGNAFTYDTYGNVTSDGSHTYQYDDASNLICADCGTGSEIDYAYDGNNRRVSRTKGGVTTYFVHASNGDLILEYTPSTNVTLEHVYLHGKRIATKKLP